MDKKVIAADHGAEVKLSQETKDADTCIKLGVGVGALGFGLGAIVGAVCPLCYVIAPALIGAGAYSKYRLKKQGAGSETESD